MGIFPVSEMSITSRIVVLPLLVATFALGACGGGGGGGDEPVDVNQPSDDDPGNNTGDDAGDDTSDDMGGDTPPTGNLMQRLAVELPPADGPMQFDIWYCEDGQGNPDAYAFYLERNEEDSAVGIEIDLDVRVNLTVEERIFPFTWEQNGADAILVTYTQGGRQDDISSIMFDSDTRFRANSARQGALRCDKTGFDNTLQDRIANERRPEGEEGPSNTSTWVCDTSDNQSFQVVFFPTTTSDAPRVGVYFGADESRQNFDWDTFASDQTQPLNFNSLQLRYRDIPGEERFVGVSIDDDNTSFSANSSSFGAIDCELSPVDP